MEFLSQNRSPAGRLSRAAGTFAEPVLATNEVRLGWAGQTGEMGVFPCFFGIGTPSTSYNLVKTPNLSLSKSLQ